LFSFADSFVPRLPQISIRFLLCAWPHLLAHSFFLLPAILLLLGFFCILFHLLDPVFFKSRFDVLESASAPCFFFFPFPELPPLPLPFPPFKDDRRRSPFPSILLRFLISTRPLYFSTSIPSLPSSSLSPRPLLDDLRSPPIMIIYSRRVVPICKLKVCAPA